MLVIMLGRPNTQLTVLLLVFQFTRFASGSCLSYGHSCWGAHGKRSSIDIITDHDVEDAQLFTSQTVPPLENQWGLQDLPDIHAMQHLDNESRADLISELSIEEQENEDEVPGDLLFITDDNKIGLPHKLALRRILDRPERKLEKAKILEISP